EAAKAAAGATALSGAPAAGSQPDRPSSASPWPAAAPPGQASPWPAADQPDRPGGPTAQAAESTLPPVLPAGPRATAATIRHARPGAAGAQQPPGRPAKDTRQDS